MRSGEVQERGRRTESFDAGKGTGRRLSGLCIKLWSSGGRLERVTGFPCFLFPAI